jgi:HAD superfamily hydrolase (TIGR01509 family)
MLSMIGAVVFDLDGVLLESEQLWDLARRELVADQGGRWRPEATTAMLGMSPAEWSSYMRSHLGLALDEGRVVQEVVTRLLAHYAQGLPLLPGAAEAVRRLARRWPIGLASSSNRVVIDHVLALAGLEDCFAATASSEEVPKGKPAPDVYLEATRRLGVPAPDCAAVEDSANGILSALAAGLAVIAIPNDAFPPPPQVLSRAAVVLGSLEELTAEVVDELGRSGAGAGQARLDD